jgi:hypothetical protein
MAEYPTDEQLEKISKWDCNDFHGLMAFIEDIWEYPERGFDRDGDIYTLITSGWSGNESIIGALQENFIVWSFYWESSTRGGKHVFAKLTIENLEKLAKK